MQYRSEIDGLRAVAILPVVLYHAGLPGLSGGFAGVDVFFVLSGYLISSIILLEHNDNRFSLLKFYERRIRRILPALFIVLITASVLAWFFLLPKAMEAFGRSILGVLTFSSNHHFFEQSDYFDVSSELKPLLHTWSLAVEEQFYILFPLIFLLLIRGGRRIVTGGLTLLVGASLFASQWMLKTDPSAAFFLLPFRAWELGLGCLAAFWLSGRQSVKGHQFASLVGFIMVLASFVILDAKDAFPGFNALLPTVGTFLLVLFAWPGTWAHWVLSRPFFVNIGLISYSLYLWHQVLFSFVRYRLPSEPSVVLLLGIVMLSVALAVVTYKLIETPFRHRTYLGFKTVAGILGVSCIVLAFFGYSAKENSGFALRFDVPEFVLRGEFAFPDTTNGWCFYSVNSNASLDLGAAGQMCELGDENGRISVLLIGDSFAGQYEPFWDVVGKSLGFRVRSVTTNWCFPSLSDAFPGPITGRAAKQCQSNRDFLKDHGAEFDVVILGGQWTTVASNGWLDQVSSVLSLLAQNHGQTHIVMPSPPQTAAQSVEAAAYGVGQPLDVRSRRELKAQAANQAMAEIVAAFPSAMLLTREHMFSNGKMPSQYTSEGRPFSLDGAHVSIYGAQKAAEVFLNSGVPKTMIEKIEKGL